MRNENRLFLTSFSWTPSEVNMVLTKRVMKTERRRECNEKLPGISGDNSKNFQTNTP